MRSGSEPNLATIATNCILNIKNSPSAWRELGNLFFKKLLTWEQFVLLSKSANNNHPLYLAFPSNLRTQAQLAAFCFQQPLLEMQGVVKNVNEAAQCANSLGMLLDTDENLPIYKGIFPEGYLKEYDNTQLSAFCFARSLMLESPPITAWNNLGIAFFNSAEPKELPYNFLDKLKLLHKSRAAAAIFCFKKACQLYPNNLEFQRNLHTAINGTEQLEQEHSFNLEDEIDWKNLGIELAKNNGNLTHLTQEFINTYLSFDTKPHDSIIHLHYAIRCFEIAIYHQPDLIHDESLKGSFAECREEISRFEAYQKLALANPIKRRENSLFQSQNNNNNQEQPRILKRKFI